MDVRSLEKEMDEIHSYVRHNISLFLTWYTFFITANLLGLRWFVTQANENQSTDFIYYISSTIGFLFVNILGFFVSNAMRSHLKSSDMRIREIILMYSESIEVSRSAVPRRFYIKSIRAIQLSLIALSIVWILLPVIQL